jgi:hypothetical protein
MRLRPLLHEKFFETIRAIDVDVIRVGTNDLRTKIKIGNRSDHKLPVEFEMLLEPRWPGDVKNQTDPVPLHHLAGIHPITKKAR